MRGIHERFWSCHINHHWHISITVDCRGDEKAPLQTEETELYRRRLMRREVKPSLVWEAAEVVGNGDLLPSSPMLSSSPPERDGSLRLLLLISRVRWMRCHRGVHSVRRSTSTIPRLCCSSNCRIRHVVIWGWNHNSTDQHNLRTHRETAIAATLDCRAPSSSVQPIFLIKIPTLQYVLNINLL